ncbi:hypothetical protein H3H45_13415 [Pseudomonas sp. SR9]|uniref:Uncharacterized protein n=2 Tax=Aquipseudomonas guryensis TaxID=2759165 RepID=A0A7W4DCS7_9GAMM|nr:hypothetical protein [Pseudomonas guryensis]
MLRRDIVPLLLAALGFALFAAIAAWRAQQPVSLKPEIGMSRVVISAPILISLYGGDRFLAANLETMRLAATSTDNGLTDSHYLIRAQLVVAELNPCHEDNYYLANGLLTWGGAVDEGNEILRRAMDCRFWDGVPAFFYGVNRSFFDRDVGEAVRAFELSAQRWPENAASMRRMAIMLQAESFNDAQLAMDYLQQQRQSTRDPRLRDMLGLRVVRLQGLIDLRAAQQRYERAHGKLIDLQQLLTSGVLLALPEDPLRLGYELRNGSIELKRLKIAGMEE